MRRGGVLAIAAIVATAAVASAAGPPRLLVLSAFPAEIDKLLTHATIDRTDVIDGRSFFVGHLAGNRVVLALTGIGLVNADKTTRDALAHFKLSGIVFSGVSGTRFRIADVMVPARWTEDGGATWTAVDPTMLEVARSVADASPPPLDSCAPLGDPACIGIDPDTVRTAICIQGGPPQIFVGGDGGSSDPFNGKPFPCVPLGGDIFGCEACRAPNPAPPDFMRFLNEAPALLDPSLITSFLQSQSSPQSSLDASDMETAAVARVANEAGKPFIGFRAASDGMGDPLMLPGFPFQFFVYRQLAADNAAAVTLAFLEAWAAH